MSVVGTHWHISPNQPKALMLAKRALATFVHDAVLLEGINFTLPEIQTLLDGVTVGGIRCLLNRLRLIKVRPGDFFFLTLKSKYFHLLFNTLMLKFYDSNDQSEMRLFLRDCLDERVIQIMQEPPS